MSESNGVQSAVRLPNFEAGGFASLNLVEDAIVDVLQGGSDDAAKSVAIFANEIDAGFEAGSLSAGQDAGGFGAELGVGLIERIEQKEIAQMKNGSLGAAEVEVVTFPERIGTPIMEKS